MRAFRRISTGALTLALLAAAACGSSTNTSTTTGPSALSRCAVTANGTGTLPAQGGNGTINVGAARECAWSASADGAWLSIRTGSTGQGDGRVEYSAASNPDPVTRRGAIVLNETRVEVTQAAGECVLTLAEAGTAIDQSGGSGRVDVRASSQLCTWRAEPDVGWIVLRGDGNGRGTGSVLFDVPPVAGPGRTGTIRVAGQTFTVTQTAGCSYSINPSSHVAGAAGSSGTVTLTTQPGCPWTTAGSVSWMTLSPAAGTGSAAVTFTVGANDGAARSGSGVIAGQLFAVQQQGAPPPTPPTPTPPAPTPPPAPPPTPPPPSCAYTVEPLSIEISAGRDRKEVDVETTDACPWTAISHALWITITSGAAGTGEGEVRLTIDENRERSPRSGTLTIAGQTVTVTQRAK